VENVHPKHNWNAFDKRDLAKLQTCYLR